MHKVTHFQLPQNMSSMFLRTDNIHSHKYRNRNAYYIQQIRTHTRKYTINFTVPTFLNTLPANLRKLVPIYVFNVVIEIKLYSILFYSILFYSIPFHSIPLHSITLHYITLHYITLHYITLHYITLHYITLHYIILYYIILY